jgi:TonB family protein
MVGDATGAPLTRSGPRPIPVAVSLTLHGAVLAYVAFAPAPGSTDRPRSLYELAIKPHEHELVWYSFRQKLPEVAPADNQNPRPGAEAKLRDQTIVSNPRNGERGAQLIWRPAPEIKPQPEVPSPNILALKLPLIPPPPPGPPHKLFTPPAPKPPKPRAPAPTLPQPPQIQAKFVLKQNALMMADLAAALLNRPKPRSFVPPVAKPERRAAAPALPEAPGIATTLRSERNPLLAENMAAPLANKPQPRKFIPPAAPGRPAATPTALPDAPKVAGQPAYARDGTRNPAFEGDIAAALANKPKPRTFVPPSQPGGGNGAAGNAVTPAIQDAPTLDAAGLPSTNVNVAVIGLNPATKLSGPLPEASRAGKFSAGPDANGGDGGGTASPGTLLTVPGLLVRNGGGGASNSAPPNPVLVARVAPTSREALEAVAKAASAAAGGAQSDDPPSTEIRLAPPPDPAFMGRDVYTLAVQMPNITSYVGSWIMWFAERVPTGPRRELRPPVPIHKVDPKYFPAAIAERVEGKVVLTGVLHTNGRVGLIRILKGVDSRLDMSAAEALLKWEFEPAERDGAPVEVDVVAEIPFLLTPQAKR